MVQSTQACPILFVCVYVCVCGEHCEKLCGCGGGGEAAGVMVWGIKTRHSHVRAQKFLLSPWIA